MFDFPHLWERFKKYADAYERERHEIVCLCLFNDASGDIHVALDTEQNALVTIFPDKESPHGYGWQER